jgi:hypothetical protein
MQLAPDRAAASPKLLIRSLLNLFICFSVLLAVDGLA